MIIGLSGYAQSGKDTLADIFVQHNDFTKMAFADPMREALFNLNPIITIGGQYAYLKDLVIKAGWETAKKMSPEVRPLMQRMGTEVGRSIFGENFWVDLAINKALHLSDVVFSDVRFKNEADAIISHGGIIIRVERDGCGPANDHLSEVEMDDYNFTYTIQNNGDIDSLIAKANVLVAAERIW